MRIRRSVLSLLISICMILGLLTGIPVYAAENTLVIANHDGWNDEENQPVKSDDPNEYLDENWADVKNEKCVYLGTSKDDPIKADQIDSISVTDSSGNLTSDVIIKPFESGWDDENDMPIIPDNGFFSVKTYICGDYQIHYGDTYVTLHVIMPRYGIYMSSTDFSEENLVPVENGNIIYSFDEENVFYAHLEIEDVYSKKLTISGDNENIIFEDIENDPCTKKITIPAGQYDISRIKLYGEIYYSEEDKNNGIKDKYDTHEYNFAASRLGIIAAWDDEGYFRENINDYTKYFTGFPVKSEKRISFGWGVMDAGETFVSVLESAPTCDDEHFHISQVYENDEPINGVYNVYADTSGTYTLKYSDGENTSFMIFEVGLPKIGIYSNNIASEENLVAAEWSTIGLKKGETYYIIPVPGNSNEEVKGLDVVFNEVFGVENNRYSWEKNENGDKLSCSFTFNNDFDGDMDSAISVVALFGSSDEPYYSYNSNCKFNAFCYKEGLVLADTWFEGDYFEENLSNYKSSSNKTSLWDGGFSIAFASYQDGENVIDPVTDMSKLSLTYPDGTVVPEDVGCVTNTYNRGGVDKTTVSGVYIIKLDIPGEYRIKYSDGSITSEVKLFVDDPAGAYYYDMPVAGDAMKNLIDNNKNERFMYDEKNRTFYFAYRSVLEIDDRGDDDESNNIEKRIYNYGDENGLIADDFMICKKVYDEINDEDIITPIEDESYAKVEAAGTVGEYTVYKITLGDTYDGSGFVTRLVKMQRNWDKMPDGHWDYLETYTPDGDDRFYLDTQEKASGLVIAWADGEKMPEDLGEYEKTRYLEIGGRMSLAAGFIVQNSDDYSVEPASDIKLIDEAGNPLSKDIASIDIKGNGLFDFETKICGKYKLAYTVTEEGEPHTYYAYIMATLPQFAFYSEATPSEQSIINTGAEEYIYDEGGKYYLCHNFTDWDLKNELSSVKVECPSNGYSKTYNATDLSVENRCFDTLTITDDMDGAYVVVYVKWNDPNRHDERHFHFMKAAEGFAVGWPGDDDVASDDYKDYQKEIHINMRCHEWRTFAVISKNGNDRVTSPIEANDTNLAKFKITDEDENEISSDNAFIRYAYNNDSKIDGIFELYFRNPGRYRIYYGDDFITLNCALGDVSFATEPGTFNYSVYDIISDDPYNSVIGSMDEDNFYIATLDGSGTNEESYNKAQITGIKLDEPKTEGVDFDKSFTYEISQDGSSAKIHVCREDDLDRIHFSVIYNVKEYQKNGDTYSPVNDGWKGEQPFTIEMGEDERDILELSDVYWDYSEPFSCDKTEKTVVLAGLDEYIEYIDVTYTDNVKTDIGKYTAKAEIKINDEYKTEYKLPKVLPETITSLEWEIVLPGNVKAVVSAIEKLPAKEKVTTTDKDAITSVRIAYDALTNIEKSFIGDDILKKLTDAETAYAEAVKKAEEEEAKKKAEEEAKKKADEEGKKKTAEDKAAAENVIKLIYALPSASAVQLSDEANITTARTAYDKLTDDQKKLILADIFKKLTDDETALEKLKAEAEAAKKNKKTLLKVGSVINDSKNNAVYKVTSVDTKKNKGTVKLIKIQDKSIKKYSVRSNIKENKVTYIVTAIGDNVFKGCENLTKVTGASNISTIGKKAFYGCKNLKSVSGMSKVTSLGVSAFQNCESLTKAPIGSKLTVISKNAFSGCSKLKSISISRKVETIGAYAFSGCSGAKKISIAGRVQTIGAYAFSGCSKAQSVSIGGYVKTMGKYVFSDCSSIKSVIVAGKAETIGAYAFSGCSNLTKIDIKTKVLSKVGSNAFKGINENAVIKVPKKYRDDYISKLSNKGQADSVKIKW